MTVKNKGTLIILFIIISLMVGCTGEKAGDQENIPDDAIDMPDETPTDSEIEVEPPKPAFGETLKITARNPETLNPLLNEDRSIDQVLKLVFESLYTIDENLKPIPNLVDNFEYSSTSGYATIYLKDNITFHNGELLTAYDVQYSIQLLQDAKDTVIYKHNVDNIQRTSVVDDYTIKVYYKQPYAFSQYDLVFPIISKAYAMSEDYNELKPTGTGPYKFVSFVSMKNLELTANNEWFKGDVYIQDIECTITRDLNAENTAFNQKLIDLINPTKFDWLQYSDASDTRMMEYTSNYYEFIGFNFNSQYLNNKEIRQGIAFAIDKENIAKNQFLNHVVLTDYPIHPESWLMEADESSAYEYNVDSATSLLGKWFEDTDEDGFYDKGNNGEAETEKVTLRLLVNNMNRSRINTANLIKENLEAIGLSIEIDAVEQTMFYDKLSAKDYDMVLSGFKLSPTPDYTALFHSTNIEENMNFISFDNEYMDAILESIYRSSTGDELYNNIQEFKSIFIDELPYYSLYFMNSAIITNDDIYGDFNPSTDNSFDGIENIFISRK